MVLQAALFNTKQVAITDLLESFKQNWEQYVKHFTFDFVTKQTSLKLFSEFIKFLLQNNENVDTFSCLGVNELHEKAWQTNLRKMKNTFYKLSPQSIFQKDILGRTPFHLVAISNQEPQIIYFFLDKGCNAFESDAFNNKPFEYAFNLNKSLKVVQIFIKQYCMHMKNHKNKFCYQIATCIKLKKYRFGYFKYEELMGQSNLSRKAIYMFETRNFLQAIKQSQNINEQNILSQTPLHLALYFFNAQNAQLLINEGAQLNTKDIFGKTQLDLILESNTYEIKILKKNKRVMKAIQEKEQAKNEEQNFEQPAKKIPSQYNEMSQISSLQAQVYSECAFSQGMSDNNE